MKTGIYLFAILALCLLTIPVLAENGSYVIVVTPTPETTPIPSKIPYISQGDVVYVGDYIDISGVVPPYLFLAYWDGFDMYDSYPSYNITLPNRKRGYYQFYLDPAIFASRLGRWYKWDGKYERQGNNRAFTVRPAKMANTTMTFPNGTVINLTEIISQDYTEHKIIPEPLLPERHISDYVVAKGDDLVFPNGSYQVWVFGRVDGIYASKNHTITKEQIERMETGHYTVVFHYPGRNTIYESTCYDSACKMLSPGLYGKNRVSIYGYAPSVVYDQFKLMLDGTDDTYEVYNLELDNPYITINRVNEIHSGVTDALNVRGYSNVKNGTIINVSLDELTMQFKYYPLWYSEGTAVQTSRGNLSYYSVNVPFSYDDLAADARNHTLTAKTMLGGSIQKDFKISVMPADSFRPNATLKYIEDRNPFVPTPTPEIVTIIKTQIVTQTITIPVTPTNETVYEQQRKAQEDITNGWVSLAVTAIVALVVLIGLGWYAMRVWRRL